MLSLTVKEHKDKDNHWLAVTSSKCPMKERIVLSLSNWCDWTDQKVSMLLTNTLYKQVIMVIYIDPLTKQSKTEEIIPVKQGNWRGQMMTIY